MDRLEYVDLCLVELDLEKLDEPLARILCQSLIDEINELREERDAAVNGLEQARELAKEAQGHLDTLNDKIAEDWKAHEAARKAVRCGTCNASPIEVEAVNVDEQTDDIERGLDAIRELDG